MFYGVAFTVFDGYACDWRNNIILSVGMCYEKQWMGKKRSYASPSTQESLVDTQKEVLDLADLDFVDDIAKADTGAPHKRRDRV